MDATLESRIKRALDQVQLSDEFRDDLLDALRDEFEDTDITFRKRAALEDAGFELGDLDSESAAELYDALASGYTSDWFARVKRIADELEVELADEFEALSKGAQANTAFHQRGFKW